MKLPQAVTPRERAFLRNFEGKLGASAVLTTPPAAIATTAEAVQQSDGVSDLEIASWLPMGIKQAVIKKAAMEAFYFLFDKEYVRADGARFMVRQELRKRLLDDLAKAKQAGEKIVIVSHSMGTMVAYDVARNCPECPAIDTLITIGSPLGIREVQDELVAIDAGRVASTFRPQKYVAGSTSMIPLIRLRQLIRNSPATFGKWTASVSRTSRNQIGVAGDIPARITLRVLSSVACCVHRSGLPSNGLRNH